MNALPTHPPAAPHNIEAEQALLGAILVKNEAFYRVADFLEPSHFFEGLHQRIYEIAGEIVRAGKAATPVTVKTFLPGDLRIGDLNAAQYLARLAAEATTIINAEDYGRIIHDLAMRRDVLAIVGGASALVNDPRLDVDTAAILSETIAKLDSVRQSNPRGRSSRMTLFSEIEAEPVKHWMVDRFLGAGEMSCFFGEPGGGKSVLVGDLAAHVAAGRPWFGRQVSRSAVLYVAAERASLVKRRLAAFRRHYDLQDLPLGVLSGTFDLRSSRTSADQIIADARSLEKITGIPVGLVVVDTISRVLAGGDENGPKDMGAVVDSLAHIQLATGAHVAAVHHIPANGDKRLRGHGALLGAVDSTISVEANGAIRTGTIDKVNDGPEGERVTFDMVSVELGRDPQTGSATTAPVVIEVADASTMPRDRKKPKRIPKSAMIAMRALDAAIAEFGEPAPASNHVPPGVKVTTIDRWREYAYRLNISTGEERARQLAFQRASQELIGGQQVGSWDALVWNTAKANR